MLPSLLGVLRRDQLRVLEEDGKFRLPGLQHTGGCAEVVPYSFEGDGFGHVWLQ